MKHPNALIAAGTGIGLGNAIVEILATIGIEISGNLGATIAGGLAALALLIGRKGIRGIARVFWRGGSG